MLLGLKTKFSMLKVKIIVRSLLFNFLSKYSPIITKNVIMLQIFQE